MEATQSQGIRNSRWNLTLDGNKERGHRLACSRGLARRRRRRPSTGSWCLGSCNHCRRGWSCRSDLSFASWSPSPCRTQRRHSATHPSRTQSRGCTRRSWCQRPGWCGVNLAELDLVGIGKSAPVGQSRDRRRRSWVGRAAANLSARSQFRSQWRRVARTRRSPCDKRTAVECNPGWLLACERPSSDKALKLGFDWTLEAGWLTGRRARRRSIEASSQKLGHLKRRDPKAPHFQGWTDECWWPVLSVAALDTRTPWCSTETSFQTHSFRFPPKGFYSHLWQASID